MTITFLFFFVTSAVSYSALPPTNSERSQKLKLPQKICNANLKKTTPNKKPYSMLKQVLFAN